MRKSKMTALVRILTTTVLGLATGPAPAAFVNNPSFENNWTASGNGDITPEGWTTVGGWGVNQLGDVFSTPGTVVADRDRYARVWHNGTLSQDISGLTPGKQYWLQFWYMARNCCGGTMVLQVSFGGAPVGAVNDAQLATLGFNFVNLPFTPTNDTGALTFMTIATGDMSAYIDAVSIVQRDAGNAVIANPSFEASGPPTDVTGNPPSADAGEVIKPAAMAGWTWDTNQSGSYGISLSGGTRADNGAVPDQDLVGFIAGPGVLSQTIANLAANTPYQLSFAYNAESAPGVNAHLHVTVDGAVVDDETVSPVGGANPYHAKTVSFTPASTNAVLAFAQTTAGGTLLLDDLRIVGQVIQHYPITFEPTAIEVAGTQVFPIQVTVPAAFLAKNSADIQLSSPSPGVVGIVGADASGTLTLHFAQGATNTQFFQVVGVGRGSSGLRASASAGLDVVQLPTVTTFTSLVLNPSFEASAPGVSPLSAWTGGSDVNNASGPAMDNGIIPDGTQVAVLEGTTNLAQQIYGLTPGKSYWLQFRYNASAAPSAAVDLRVTLGGKVLTAIKNINPAGAAVGDAPFYFTNVVFTPANASELLVFSTSPTVAGTTPALLLDAVSMVQRDAGEVVIENPSFEAGGEPASTSYPLPMAGWTFTGHPGANFSPGDTFGDNGMAPDQGEVLYMWHEGTATASVSGLTAGQVYTLWYGVNARLEPTGSVLTYDVAFGDLTLLSGKEVDPIGDDIPYFAQYLVFTNDAPTATLVFTTHNVGDTSILLDDIHLAPGAHQPPAPSLAVTQSAGMAVITWPVSAQGFTLQETSALPGGWTNSTATVVVQGSSNVVTVTPSGEKFYRLKK